MHTVVLALVVVIASALPATAAEYVGPVVAIEDGDTFTVSVNAARAKVRLCGVDSPERGEKGYGPAGADFPEGPHINDGEWDMVDKYTHCVLTVIAGALVAIAIQGLIGPSTAQQRNVQKVQICDELNCVSLFRNSSASQGGFYSYGLPIVKDPGR